MNNINFFYLFLPLFIFILSFFNIKIPIVLLIGAVILFFIFFEEIKIFYFIYSIFSSLVIVLKLKTNSFKYIKTEIQKLEKILEEKEKKLLDFKKTSTDIKIYEKKNEIIYSIINILRNTTNIENLKIIKKYVDKYIEADTSLIFFSNDKPILVYGKSICLEIMEKSHTYKDFTIIDITDKEQKMFSLILNTNEKSKIENAKELINEVKSSFKKIYLFEVTENMSQKDGLTGLYRKGIFIEKLDEEIIKAKNFKNTVGLMMIDIDHFKNINDTYGHQVGDDVLKEVSMIIKENVYETDFVARYGGEEFAIIMPRALLEGSTRKANYIRELISLKKIKAGLVDIKVTISIGIAYYPFDATNSKDLIEKADEALYFSKKNGRNKVTLYKDIKI